MDNPKDAREFNQCFENVFAGFFLEERSAKEKDPNYKSKWSAYIDTLQLNECFDFPINYGDNEMKLLDGSHRVQFEVAVRKVNIKNELIRLQKGVSELKSYSTQQFTNALLMCKSRIWD